MSLFSGLRDEYGAPTTKADILTATGVPALVLLLAALFSSFVVVGVGEVNVITRMGSVNRDVYLCLMRSDTGV